MSILRTWERRVTRSIWHQVLGNCKADASAKPVPMDSHMAEDLLRWRRQSIYASDDDYVFASETMRGKQPFWPDNLMKREIRPVAKANGIHEKIGWHTSRDSFVTLLKANGEDVKTVQELLSARSSFSKCGGFNVIVLATRLHLYRAVVVWQRLSLATSNEER
jgi:site-specific recombinase XerD